MIEIKEQNKLQDCSKGLLRPQADEIAALMRQYGADAAGSIALIDSSHGADDIRWNHIVDGKYVLRFCNAPQMTESRMEDLNRLIGRYRAFGLKCPLFIKGSDGRFFRPWRDLTVYLSEYVDLPIAEETDGVDKDALRTDVVRMLARFMDRYRDVDLIPTMGMYSLFDLCPFDVPLGIDEKQQNLNSVCDALDGIGEHALSERLAEKNHTVRAALLTVFRSLPRCVTQGDENLSNVLIDERKQLAGLIDFNLAGTDVCVNLIANNADFDLCIENDDPIAPAEALSAAVERYRKNAAMLLGEYHATDAERDALPYYAWIALASQYPYACAYAHRIKKEETRADTLQLIERIAALPVDALRV